MDEYIDIPPTNPNNITRVDIYKDSFDYNIIHSKISNLIKNREIKTQDHINKLLFESESLRNDFYRIIKNLNLTNFKQVHRTKIEPLLKSLERFIDISPTNPNPLRVPA